MRKKERKAVILLPPRWGIALATLASLLLTGCYETVTGYKLIGEYQSPAPPGYWGDSKLSYNKNKELQLSIALEKSTLSEFSQPPQKEVKLPGIPTLSVQNIIREKGLSSFALPVFAGVMSPYFHLIYEGSRLKAIVHFTPNSHLQILNPQGWSVKNEIKVEKTREAFVRAITCSDDLQYLAVSYSYSPTLPLDHAIEIYKLNNQSNTFRFHRTLYLHHGMFFSNMLIDNNMLIINLQKGARSTIKTSRVIFYDLEKESVECEYIKKNHTFVRAAAVTPDHEYLIITADTIRLYRRTPRKK